MQPRLGLAALIGLVLFVVLLVSGSPQTSAHAQADTPALTASHAPLGALGARAPLTTTTPVMTTPTSTATATPVPCEVGEWNLRAPYPTPIAGAAGVAQDGILYNFGGALPTTVLTDSYKYTPATNTWAAIAPLPAPRLVAGAVSDGTYIYILGGTIGQGATNTFWRYDPVQDTYLALASSPVSVNSPAMAYLNGKIYRIGGCTAGNGLCTGDEIDTVDVYTIATGTWAPAAPYPLARSSIAATALSGYIYTAGGVTQSPWFTGSPKTYRYDPATNTWDDTAIADLPGSITDVVSGMLNGRWILAGAGQGGSFAGAWDPGTDTWTLLPSPPLAHDFASGGSTGQAFYVVGGFDPNDTWQADTQEYREPPCPPTPTVTGTPPTATATATASPTVTPASSPTATQTPLPCGVGAWTLRTPYPTAVAGAAGVIKDGILYNFGGTSTDGIAVLTDTYKYTPGADTWTPLAPLPAPRVVASAVSDGTYIYILGGWGTQGPTNTFWRYDPAQNTYAALAPATLNVGGAALVYLNGKIYRIGGCTVRNGDCSGGQTDTVDVYTIATDTWVPAASYPLIRGHISATVRNGYIYTAGGVDASGIGTPKTYRYDPAGNTWDDAAIADLPGAITDTVNGILNGRWILAGPGFAVAWDPDADTWTLLPFPLVRADHASGGSTGDAFYVVGGFDFSLNWHTWHAETQEYREVACPPTPTVTGTPPTATATASPTVTAMATATASPTVTARVTATPTNPPLATVTPLPCQIGEWTVRAPYPTAVYAAAGAALGDSFYSFGGAGASPTEVVADAYKYTPATDTWTAVAPLPAPRLAAGVTTDGTYIYILGGVSINSPTNTFWRYDPAQNSYSALASPSISVGEPALVYLDGKIYRIGGCTGQNFICTDTMTNSVEVYTIATDSWAPAGPYPVTAGSISTTVLNGYLYAAGGETASYRGSAKTYRYDPETDTWDDAAIIDLPGAVYGVVGGVLNGRWILSGAGFAIAWDPSLNLWTLLPSPFVSQAFPSGGILGQALYVIGGINWGDFEATTEEYREPICPPSPTATAPPATPTTTVPPSATVPPASPTATATPCGITFSDVLPTDYFAAAVHDLACRGVISGYADGTFRPYNLTSRAQMVKIVVLGFGYPIRTPPPDRYTFADVPPAHPFWSVIETAAAAGIVSGYTCGGPGEPCDGDHRPYFRPYSLVTRGQLAKIVVGGAGWPVLNPPGATFADVDPAHPFYGFVETAAAHGVISGYDCGGSGEPCDPAHRPYFRPANDATRGQIAKIVDLALPQAAGPLPSVPGLLR